MQRQRTVKSAVETRAALVVAKGGAKSIPILTAIGVTAIDRRTRIYGGARFGRIRVEPS
jgi:hypothetical protein